MMALLLLLLLLLRPPVVTGKSREENALIPGETSRPESHKLQRNELARSEVD